MNRRNVRRGSTLDATTRARISSPFFITTPCAWLPLMRMRATSACDADLDTRGARRARDRVGDRSGSAASKSPRAERAVDLAHVVMEEHVGGSRRSHAEERPDDARRRHRGLEHVGLEPLVEKIHRAHRHELDLVVLIGARQATKPLQQEEQLLESSRIERGRIRRQHAEDRSNEATHLDHGFPVFVVGLGVEPRVPRDLATRLRVVVHAPQVVTVGHRRERAVEREDLEPMAGRSSSRMISGRSSETT